MKSRYAKTNSTGEYPKVLHNVKDANRLIALHRTAISESDAKQIIDAAIVRFDLRYLKNVSINSRNTRGKASAQVLVLPNKTLMPEHLEVYGSVIGKLRIGLVLHELAHTYHRTQRIYGIYHSIRKFVPHGKDFCYYLDNLIDWYLESFNAADMKLAAEVAERVAVSTKAIDALIAIGIPYAKAKEIVNAKLRG